MFQCEINIGRYTCSSTAIAAIWTTSFFIFLLKIKQFLLMVCKKSGICIYRSCKKPLLKRAYPVGLGV